MTSRKTRGIEPAATPLCLFSEAELEQAGGEPIAPPRSTRPFSPLPGPADSSAASSTNGDRAHVPDLLTGLNEAQRRAVTTTEGPLLILAGPGSGKTRVLTHRIAYLVAERAVDPWHILAVTFTNRAAREMRERLLRLVGANASREMAIGTFHAICLRLLRSSAADSLLRYGLTPSFVVCDTDEQLRLVREAMKHVPLEGLPEQEQTPSAVHGRILRAKNALLGPDQMAEQAGVYQDVALARIYKAYTVLLRKNNAVDFEDLLWVAEHLLRSDSEVLRLCQGRWHYLHVDEFKDCTLLQYRLVRELSWGSEACHEGRGTCARWATTTR